MNNYAKIVFCFIFHKKRFLLQKMTDANEKCYTFLPILWHAKKKWIYGKSVRYFSPYRLLLLCSLQPCRSPQFPGCQARYYLFVEPWPSFKCMSIMNPRSPIGQFVFINHQDFFIFSFELCPLKVYILETSPSPLLSSFYPFVSIKKFKKLIWLCVFVIVAREKTADMTSSLLYSYSVFNQMTSCSLNFIVT